MHLSICTYLLDILHTAYSTDNEIMLNPKQLRLLYTQKDVETNTIFGNGYR